MAALKGKIAVAISGAPWPTQASLRKAQAALDAIEAAGYVVVPKGDWQKGLSDLPRIPGASPINDEAQP